MWPFTHLAIGYLLSSGYVHARRGRPPDELAAVLVLVGTQLPDVVDKPLALVGALESGRSLGHSVLFGLPVVALVAVAVYRRRSELESAVVFGLSYLSAVFFDGAQQFLQGTVVTDIREVSFWVWPVTPPAERIVARLRTVPVFEYVVVTKPSWTAANLPAGEELHLYIRLFELLVTAAAVALWVADGTPGVATVHATASRIRRYWR